MNWASSAQQSSFPVQTTDLTPIKIESTKESEKKYSAAMLKQPSNVAKFNDYIDT